jgi:hypothetical protein
MTKSNVTEVEVAVHDGSSRGRGYYCAGRQCAVKERCHRHTSGIMQQDAVFNDYDILMLSEETCKYFVDVKKVAHLGPKASINKSNKR